MRSLLLLAITLVLSCNQSNEQIIICDKVALSAPTLPNAEDLQVFQAILNEFHSNGKLPLVVQQTAGNIRKESIEQYVENGIIIAHVATIEDYDQANDNIYLMAPLPEPFQLIHQDELDCFFNTAEGGWQSFYAKYTGANGFVQFHRPGYHPDGNKAIIEYVNYYTYLGAEGFVVSLEKHNGKWQVTVRALTWIS